MRCAVLHQLLLLLLLPLSEPTYQAAYKTQQRLWVLSGNGRQQQQQKVDTTAAAAAEV
jgi:hypothetical protein